MEKKRKVLWFAVIVVMTLAACVTPVSAWNTHGACTAVIIADEAWLKQYSNITVTAWSYETIDTAAVGPDFKLKYVEGPPGTTTSAAAILVNYADEPDWDLDSGLNLSKLQILTGGSQGWRHQYYGLGWLRLGEGPARAQYFFNLAEQAYKGGDLYWTFRYLARSLHYVQDLTEPYHGVPAPIGIIFKGITDFNALFAASINHHYNLEEYQGAMVGMGSPAFITALRSGQAFDLKEATSARWLGVHGTYVGRDYVRTLWKLEEDFFGDQIDGKEKWIQDMSTLGVAAADTSQAVYDQQLAVSLTMMSGYTKTLLQLARSKIGL